MAASGGNIEWSTTVKPILTALYGPFFDKNDAVEIIQAIIKRFVFSGIILKVILITHQINHWFVTYLYKKKPTLLLLKLGYCSNGFVKSSFP